MKSHVISARMSINDLAKARDGLISKGIEQSELATISQILKLTFYYGIIHLCQFPKSPASKESVDFIEKKFTKTNS